MLSRDALVASLHRCQLCVRPVTVSAPMLCVMYILQIIAPRAMLSNAVVFICAKCNATLKFVGISSLSFDNFILVERYQCVKFVDSNGNVLFYFGCNMCCVYV